MREAERKTAVRVQRAILIGVVASIVALLDAAGPVLTRGGKLAALALLRPAEAATRRLIVMVMDGLGPVAARVSSSMPSGGIRGGGGAVRRSAFRLFDPRKNPKPDRKLKSAPGNGPQAGVIGIDPHVVAPPRRAVHPDDPVDDAALRRRLDALTRALDDLPGQARRLARILAGGRSRWKRPMRPGRPPGHREGGTRPVDEALADCHFFALEVMRERTPP